MYSTVLDLAKFVIMNMNGGQYKGKRVLREDTVEEMQKLQAPTGRSRSGMGLTWFRTIHHDNVMLYHTGGLPDFTNHVCFYPELGIGVCWLSNLQDGSSWRPPAPTVLRMAAGLNTPATCPQSPPDNWEKITGTYGEEQAQLNIRVANGFLTLGDRLTLEKIDETRFKVHGLTNDGEELTLEYGDDGYVAQLDLGTSYYRRSKPEAKKVDVGADLTGVWIGEYYDAYGFHATELRVTNRNNATIRDQSGEHVKLHDFRAELGQVIGKCSFRIPREYARWGTADYVAVNVDLKARNGELVGSLSSPGGVSQLTLVKK
jgi:hypothetical protein